MKKEAKELFSRSLDSMFNAIEHYNKPYDRGRPEAVLIFIDRAFELFLKATIIEKGGRIREPGDPHTIGFTACVRKCVSDVNLKCLNEEEALTIQNINLLRDAAQHYIISVSEQQLFIQAQAGLSLYKKLLKEVMQQDFHAHFPERVMPIASKMPKDFQSLLASEFLEIRELLAPKSRKSLEAKAKVRSLAILESSMSGKNEEPSERDVNKFVSQIKNGAILTDVFPEIAKFRIISCGFGASLTVRITKNEGDPVRLVPEGTPNSTVVGVRRVNEFDHWSMSSSDMAKKLGLTGPRFYTLCLHLKIREHEEYYKEFRRAGSIISGYTQQALHCCKQALKDGLDMDMVWGKHRPPGRLGLEERQRRRAEQISSQ